MPFIRLQLGKKLTEEQVTAAYGVLAEHISLIPTKTIDNAMMQIDAGQDLFMHGEKGEYAFLEVRLLGPSPAESKEAFVAAVSKGLQEKLGIDPKKTYVNILELDAWGSGGHFNERK